MNVSVTGPPDTDPPARWGVIAAVLVLLAAAHGCGYRLRSANERFTGSGLRMDVPVFSNDTSTPDAGAWIAARLREELRKGGFRGSFGREGADFRVEGKVREIREEVFSHGADRFSLENRLTVVVEVRILDAVRGRIRWKEAALTETASYFSGIDAQYTESNRRAAFEEAARRVSVRISRTIQVIL